MRSLKASKDLRRIRRLASRQQSALAMLRFGYMRPIGNIRKG
jgi:hypothetical protein